MFIVKKIANKIKLLSKKYNFRHLSKNNLETLNDKTYFYHLNENILNKNKFLEILKMIFNKFEQIKVIKTDHNFHIYWQIVLLLINLLMFFSITLNLSFKEFSNCFNQIFTYIAFIYFVEIFLNLNIAYYEQGTEIKSRIKIMMHYLKSEFIIDSIIIMVILALRDNLIALLFIVKIKKINESINYIDENFQI